MSHETFMRQAIAEAEVAVSKGNWPIGCVIVLDNEVIAKAHNLVYSSKNRLAHAEMLALTAAQPQIFNRPGEATLYTTYEPCPMCFGACLNARVGKVVYGVDLNESGAVHLQDYLPGLYTSGGYDTEFEGGILAEECEAVYRLGEAAVLATRQAIVRQR